MKMNIDRECKGRKIGINDDNVKSIWNNIYMIYCSFINVTH